VSSYPSSTATRGDGPKSPLVLVIDDGAEARELYCTYLEYSGLGAQAAEDGPAGIAMALATKPDVVVLDFSMPKMDGAEVLRRLKADERTQAIPVVMLTAVPELVGSRARAACAAFLEKPCEPEELVQTLVGLIRERRSLQSD
jgi:two-component system, cell cycle response regulator DivK